MLGNHSPTSVASIQVERSKTTPPAGYAEKGVQKTSLIARVAGRSG